MKAIAQLLRTHTEAVERSYQAGELTDGEPVKTAMGTLLYTADDCLQYTALHEALHLGFADRQIKFSQQPNRSIQPRQS